MRKLVTIRQIKSINPIKDADFIEVATIDGWNVVVKKGEFKAGDSCVYFEIDSIIPRKDWNEFLADKNNPEKPIRLKTITFKGQISQGLALPLKTVFPETIDSLNIGDDVTDMIGVEKYIPPVPACLSGEVRGKIPFPVTDEERIQNIPEIIDIFKGVDVYISQKIDGTSTSFGLVRSDDGESTDFHVCGRNWSYKDTVDNTYWEMAKKYNVEEILRGLSEKTGVSNWAIQGETYGQGIQGNKLKIQGHEFALFNVLMRGIKYDWMNPDEEYYDIVSEFLSDIPKVRVLYKGEFIWNSVEELLEFADTFNYPNGSIGEGIVIRPIKRFVSANGYTSFKVISNKFLKKYKE